MRRRVHTKISNIEWQNSRQIHFRRSFTFLFSLASGASNQNNASQESRKKSVSSLQWNEYPSFLSLCWCLIETHMLFYRLEVNLERNPNGISVKQILFERNVEWLWNPFPLNFNDNRISKQALSFQQHSAFSTDCNLSKCCNDGNRSRSSYVSDLKADGKILSFFVFSVNLLL